VRLLLAVIEGSRSEAMRVELSTALVPGDSTAPPR
jgi:DNA-binding LacI/PurR family transcriptional regulator